MFHIFKQEVYEIFYVFYFIFLKIIIRNKNLNGDINNNSIVFMIMTD